MQALRKASRHENDELRCVQRHWSSAAEKRINPEGASELAAFMSCPHALAVR